MATKKNDPFAEKRLTPRMIAVWPRLTTPDTKFDSAGVYTVEGRTDDSAFITLLEKMYQAALKIARKENPEAEEGPKPYKPDPENPGMFIVGKFKMKASGIKNGKAWTRRPILFDAAGEKLPPNVLVGGGSEIVVSFQPKPYLVKGSAGVTMYIEAVQVRTLVAPNSADRFGFDTDGEGLGFGDDAGTNENPFSGGDTGADESDDDSDDFSF